MSETARTAEVTVPDDVRAFAREQGVEAALPAVLEAAQRAFPGAQVSMVLEEDYETEGLYYIVVTVRDVRMSVEQWLQARDAYYRDLFVLVTAPRVGAFRLHEEFAP